MKMKRINLQNEVDQSRMIVQDLDLDQDQGVVRHQGVEDGVQVQGAEADEDQEALVLEVAEDQEVALQEEVADLEAHLQDVVNVHQLLNRLKLISTC